MSELSNIASSVSNQVYVNKLNQDRSYSNSAELNKPLVSERQSSIPTPNSEKSSEGLDRVITPTLDEVSQTLDTINKQLQDLANNYLQFERDESSDRIVIYIKNSETNELIRQIPSEDFLRIAKNIDAYIKQVNESFSTKTALPVGLITHQQA